MGSFFAGVKAGTLGGIIYVGGIAVFNVLLLYALQQNVLKEISQLSPQLCPYTPNINGSAMDCFSSVISVDVPFVAFVAFFISLIYAGVFGLYYDSLPSKSTTLKGMMFAVIICANLVFFGFSAYVFDTESIVLAGVFLLGWTPFFGYLLGSLYKKYTRVISFASQDPSLLKVIVDGRDCTGKGRTFATTSSHKVRAEVAEDASFKEWEAEGGITLDDSRSFETAMEVNGDGTLLGKVGPKY